MLFSRQCSTSMKISIIEGNEKYDFGVELQSHELNSLLRKTAMIVRQISFAKRRFRNSSVRISRFFREIVKDKSKLVSR